MKKYHELALYGVLATLVITFAWAGLTIQKINHYEQEVMADKLEVMKSDIKQMELDLNNEQLKDRVIILPRRTN